MHAQLCSSVQNITTLLLKHLALKQVYTLKKWPKKIVFPLKWKIFPCLTLNSIQSGIDLTEKWLRWRRKWTNLGPNYWIKSHRFLPETAPILQETPGKYLTKCGQNSTKMRQTKDVSNAIFMQNTILIKLKWQCCQLF